MPPLILDDRPNGNALHIPVENSLQSSVLPRPSFHQPINGVLHDAFRFLPQDRINGAENIPVSSALPPVSGFMPPAQIASATPTGRHQTKIRPDSRVRKVNKATQVGYASRRYNYYGALLTNS